MPRGDGTGPARMGPMTGRAAGFCAGYPVPGYMNPAVGRGFWGWGRGRGGGRGRRHWFWATGVPGWPAWGAPVVPFGPAMTPAPQQELEALKQQASYFQDALKDIQERIDELQADAAAQK